MFDEEIEKAILYFVIFEEEELELTEQDFVNKTHKEIIKVINNIKAKKEEISLLAIKSKIGNKEKDILQYMSDLGKYTYKTNVNMAYKILKTYTKKRQMLEVSREVQAEIKENENVDIYIEKIINKLQKIQAQTEKEESFVESVSKTANLIEKNMNKKKNYDFYTRIFRLRRTNRRITRRRIDNSRSKTRSWKNDICITNS